MEGKGGMYGSYCMGHKYIHPPQTSPLFSSFPYPLYPIPSLSSLLLSLPFPSFPLEVWKLDSADKWIVLRGGREGEEGRAKGRGKGEQGVIKDFMSSWRRGHLPSSSLSLISSPSASASPSPYTFTTPRIATSIPIRSTLKNESGGVRSRTEL